METKIEKIGSVILDLTYYPGEDFYSDGDIEDEMLDIAMNNPVNEFPRIIEERKSWPIFYHFSPFRANIIDWIPFKKTDKVLEIGAGCGAITGALAKRVGSVTCVDLSKKRSLVNAYRNKDYDNIKIMVGNFKDVEPNLDTDYDYVLLIGVFEYGKAYIGGDTPYEDFMEICNRHRNDNGRMVIAIENKFGLKYFAGCREDHLGTYFSGLEGYREGGSARTFTRQGLEKILAKTQIAEYEFYYPYPDYKFMTTIFSDQYLPKKGELSNNLRNFDRDRVLLFDETAVFDQIIDEGEFPLFSNSYLLVIGKAFDVVYTKFSNDRDSKWAIQTKMVIGEKQGISVEKHADNEIALEHIRNTKLAFEKLSERYEGTRIVINRCSAIENDIKNGLSFEFCKGKTLEAMLDECLLKSDMEGFKKLIDEYMYWLGYKAEEYPISNIDFVFPNIIVDCDKWQIIDYEWTYDRYIDPNKIAFRAFYNYCLGGENRNSCKELLMGEILGMDEAMIKKAVIEEAEFQKNINGNRASVDAMREIIGNKAVSLNGLLELNAFTYAKFVAQLFFDCGEGFNETNSVILKDCVTELRKLNIKYELPPNIKNVRIDPTSYKCCVIINKISIDGRIYDNSEIETNGVVQDGGVIVFNTSDPNIVVHNAQEGILSVDIDVYDVPEALAAQLTVVKEDNSMINRIKGIFRK
jgi:hypothetical protein